MALREKLTGLDAQRYGSLPKVRLPGDEVLQRHFNEEAADILKSKPIFRRDKVVVTPYEEKRRLELMKPETFVSWAEDYLAPYKCKLDRYGDPFDVIKPMGKDIAKNCLESYQFSLKLMPIENTYPIPMPIIAEDGTMELATPGYNEATKTYVYQGDVVSNPNFKEKNPSANKPSSNCYYDDNMSLVDAVTFLYQVHCQFPFSDWQDEFIPEGGTEPIRKSRSFAVHISAAISLFAQGCIPRKASRMGYIYNANSQRSGKTLLVKMIVGPIFGTTKIQSWRPNDEDMLKLLDSETLAASNYLVFDNIRGMINSQPLEGFMTTHMWTGRILGRSETFEAENNATIFITGNQCQAGTDMQHRLLWADLNVEEANIQERTNKLSKIIDDVWISNPTNRIKFLSALWSLVRHWDEAGRPLSKGTPKAGFDTWGRIIGGIIDLAGLGDIHEAIKLDNAGDTEADEILRLITILSYKLPSNNIYRYTFQNIVNVMHEEEILQWLLHGREENKYDDHKGAFADTFKLNPSATAKVGNKLTFYCNGEKGKVYSVHRNGVTEKIRFYCEGKGRHKKYILHHLPK